MALHLWRSRFSEFELGERNQYLSSIYFGPGLALSACEKDIFVLILQMRKLRDGDVE